MEDSSHRRVVIGRNPLGFPEGRVENDWHNVLKQKYLNRKLSRR